MASIARLPSSTDDPRASGSTADRHESVERTGAPLEVMSTHRFQSIANCKGGKGPSTPLKRKKENGQPNISPRSHLRADDFFYSRLTLHATQHSVPEQLLSKGLFRHQARPPPALFSASPLPRSAHNRPGFDGESASWQRLCAQHTLRLQNLRPADASSVASRPGLATISPQRRTTEADQAASLVGRHPTPETADRALKPCAPAAAETHQPCWTWRRGWPRRPCAPPHRR